MPLEYSQLSNGMFVKAGGASHWDCGEATNAASEWVARTGDGARIFSLGNYGHGFLPEVMATVAWISAHGGSYEQVDQFTRDPWSPQPPRRANDNEIHGSLSPDPRLEVAGTQLVVSAEMHWTLLAAKALARHLAGRLDVPVAVWQTPDVGYGYIRSDATWIAPRGQSFIETIMPPSDTDEETAVVTTTPLRQGDWTLETAVRFAQRRANRTCEDHGVWQRGDQRGYREVTIDAEEPWLADSGWQFQGIVRARTDEVAAISNLGGISSSFPPLSAVAGEETGESWRPPFRTGGLGPWTREEATRYAQLIANSCGDNCGLWRLNDAYGYRRIVNEARDTQDPEGGWSFLGNILPRQDDAALLRFIDGSCHTFQPVTDEPEEATTPERTDLTLPQIEGGVGVFMLLHQQWARDVETVGYDATPWIAMEHYITQMHVRLRSLNVLLQLHEARENA